MVKKCFVPNCRSGYIKSSVTISMFTPPKDDEMMKIWRKNIPRSDRMLTRNDRVCEKHFDSKFIVREWNNGLTVIPLDMPRLSKDAFPSMFPGCPAYLNVIVSKPSLPLIRQVDGMAKKSRTRKQSDESGNAADCSFPVEGIVDDREIKREIDEKEELLPFEELWKANNNGLVQIPSELWTSHKIENEGKKYISFCRLCIMKDSLSYVEREVLIDAEFHIKVAVNGVHIVENIPENDKSLKYVQDLMFLVDNLKVCSGGPSFAKYDPSSTYTECAKPEHSYQVWRHLKCPLILSSLQRCSFCNTLRDTMRIQQKRKATALTLRVRMKSSLVTKSQLVNLRHMLKMEKMISYRAKKKIAALTEELQSVKDKTKKGAEKVEDYMLQNNLPEQQNSY